MKKNRVMGGLLAAGICAAALSGYAVEENRPRFEIFLSYGSALSGCSTSYTNEYDPNPGYKIAGSYVRQTLAVEPAAGGQLALGGTWYSGRRLGLRLSFFSERRPIGGENSPYEVLYLYTSTIPPYYTPIDTQRSFQYEWPPTDGELKLWGGTLAVVLRLMTSEDFAFSLTGGFSLASASGRFFPLGFTDLWQGGHGILCIEDYFVYLELPPKILTGAVFGLEAEIRLSRHFWLRLEAEYGETETYQAVPRIDKVISTYFQEADPASRALIEKRFNLRPLSLPLSRAFIGAGIVIRL